MEVTLMKLDVVYNSVSYHLQYIYLVARFCSFSNAIISLMAQLCVVHMWKFSTCVTSASSC